MLIAPLFCDPKVFMGTTLAITMVVWLTHTGGHQATPNAGHGQVPTAGRARRAGLSRMIIAPG